MTDFLEEKENNPYLELIFEKQTTNQENEQLFNREYFISEAINFFRVISLILILIGPPTLFSLFHIPILSISLAFIWFLYLFTGAIKNWNNEETDDLKHMVFWIFYNKAAIK